MLETNLTHKVRNNHPKQLHLFEEESLVPLTEGIKYTGSKLKHLPHILAIVRSLSVKRIFDGFSGTTRVSQAFAKSNYQVTANDLSVWSKVFGECYLKGKKSPQLQDKIDHLNRLVFRTLWR